MKRILMATTAAAVVGALALSAGPGFAGPGHGTAPGKAMQTTAAPAQSGMGPGMMVGKGMGAGMMGGQGMGMMGPHGFDTALTGVIKEKLRISADQEPAWQAFIDALKGRAETMAAMRAGMETARDGDLRAEDRLAIMDSMRQSGRKAFEGIQAAREKLFAVLTGEQSQRAETLPPGAMMGQGMGHQGMMQTPSNGDRGTGDASQR